MRSKAIRISLVAAMVLCWGCSQSPQAKEAKYLQKGKAEYQKKNYAVAILQFKNAMAAQPRHAEPYYQLGLAYEAGGDFNTAYSYFKKATELDPKHTGAQVKLAELLATSGRKDILEDALKRSQDVLTLLPEDVNALNVLAVTELKLGKPESAEAHLEQALRKSPSDLKSAVVLAQTRLARKDTAGAEESLKQAVAQAPKSPEPSLYLGGFYQALGRTAEAEQQFRHAIQIDPKHGPALMALAALQVRGGHADQADQTYRQVSALPDKQYRPIHALYLFQSGKRDEALAEFEKLYKADPADRGLRTNLVRSYLSLNKVSDAERILTEALKKNKLDVDALLQRSRIYLGSRKWAEAQTDLNQVLHFRRESAEAHYLLGKVQQGRGDSTAHQQELGEALRLDPSYLAARIDLAQALILNRGAQSALELLDKAPAAQKQVVGVVIQRNWALLVLGQTAEARKGVDQVLAAGKVPDALLQDAVLKLNQKDYTGCRTAAEAVLAQTPEDTRALNILMQSYAAQKQVPAGVQQVREYAAKHPASAPVQQYLGQLLAANGDMAGARKAFEAAKAGNASAMVPDLALAQMDASAGNLDGARKRLSGVVASHPDDIRGQILLANVELSDGKSVAAIDHYRKAVALDERNAEAVNGLAYVLADAKQADEALKYAQKAKALAPENAAVDDTLGWTYYQKGMYSLAVTHLASAVAREGTARRQYHLAMACLKAGDPGRGRKVLETALKLDPKLPEAQEAKQLFDGAGK
jgi:tetratricopeptide (TPR) repeat protein